RLSMRLRSLLDRQKRGALFSELQKGIRYPFRGLQETTPVFIFGRQRSGTSMLMFAFHMHPDTVVFDEHRNSIVFKDYQVRNFQIVHDAIHAAKTPFACFKPICDSHRIEEFRHEFPKSRLLWAFRHYKAAARSALERFGEATRAVRLVCTGRRGGGWFQDGVSPTTEAVLREIYSTHLTEFDLCCLAWWARNQIIIENSLATDPAVTLVKYEQLAVNGRDELAWVFDRIGLHRHERCGRFINSASVTKSNGPALTPEVRALCEHTMEELDGYYQLRRHATAAERPRQAVS
ncbi:MAG: hypothetical protein WD609_11415, partial [Aquisalimonadaceae bacterium]